ncbi:MAG: hypothetical protein JKY34_11910 [Kordiimonadaceae bacterium]|nr:hypothetical protein [Kordiimonadaceae bacterium]
MADFIAQYFTLYELVRSNRAETLHIDNSPKEAHIFANLGALATNTLDPLRKLLDAPVSVSSGYRCSTLNRALGGARDSQHTFGEAADIRVKGIDCYDAALRIFDAEIDFDQLISENKWDHKTGSWISWLHISCRRMGINRREVLTSHRGPSQSKMIYERGLFDPRIERA